MVQFARAASFPGGRRAKKRSMDLDSLGMYEGTGAWIALKGRESLERVLKPEGKVVAKAWRW